MTSRVISKPQLPSYEQILLDTVELYAYNRGEITLIEKILNTSQGDAELPHFGRLANRLKIFGIWHDVCGPPAYTEHETQDGATSSSTTALDRLDIKYWDQFQEALEDAVKSLMRKDADIVPDADCVNENEDNDEDKTATDLYKSEYPKIINLFQLQKTIAMLRLANDELDAMDAIRYKKLVEKHLSDSPANQYLALQFLRAPASKRDKEKSKSKSNWTTLMSSTCWHSVGEIEELLKSENYDLVAFQDKIENFLAKLEKSFLSKPILLSSYEPQANTRDRVVDQNQQQPSGTSTSRELNEDNLKMLTDGLTAAVVKFLRVDHGVELRLVDDSDGRQTSSSQNSSDRSAKDVKAKLKDLQRSTAQLRDIVDDPLQESLEIAKEADTTTTTTKSRDATVTTSKRKKKGSVSLFSESDSDCDNVSSPSPEKNTKKTRRDSDVSLANEIGEVPKLSKPLTPTPANNYDSLMQDTPDSSLLCSPRGKRKKNKFSEEEDQAILEGVEQIGRGKWTEIRVNYEELFNRTTTQIKDRWRTIQTQKAREKAMKEQNQTNDEE